MNLYEYQGKRLFKKYGIPVKDGILITKEQENDYVYLQELQQALNFPVVIKAQVKVGGRGKAGAIKVAHNNEEFMKYIKQILNSTVKGVKVNKVLIDPYVSIDQELYMSFAIDRSRSRAVFIFSPVGGVDIEEVAQKEPDKISKEYIDNLDLFNFNLRNAILRVFKDYNYAKKIEDVAFKLYKLFKDYHCVIAEINPLVISSGQLLALDSKIIIDENSMVDESLMEDDDEEVSVLEREAKDLSLAYVELDGNIGVIGNGAGLVMYTIDLINLYGGKAANFLDVGGGAQASKIKQSLGLVLKNPKVKAVLINIFGGITRCDEVAKGIIDAYNENKCSVPLVIRLQGTNYEEGKKILEDARDKINFDLVDDAEKGAQLVILKADKADR